MIRRGRVLRCKTSTRWAWEFCFTAIVFSCTGALACPAPSLERTIIFNRVLTDLDASVIVEVTILDRGANVIDPSNGIQMAVLNARVDNVVKGRIGEGNLKIVAELSDCNKAPGVGSHGFAMGELRGDSKDNLELVAISERRRKAISRPQ